MIHINLLPPELRKRRTGSNPVVYGAVGGGVLCVLMGALLYVVKSHVDDATTLLDVKTQDLVTKTAQADQVIKIEASIDDFKKQRDYIVNLLAQKMYWAHTLDEFVTTLNGPPWSIPGYDVRCSDLSISKSAGNAQSPRRIAGDGDQVSYTLVWRYRIYGKDMAQSGDYIKSFFNSLAASKLWQEHGFVDQPDRSFSGYNPKWNAAIERSVMENTLEWQRVKNLAAKSAKGN